MATWNNLTAYRTHSCGEVSGKNEGEEVVLSGWIHRKRNHGQLIFFDLRDHYGLTQCIIESHHSLFCFVEELSLESVVRVQGRVVKRSPQAIKKDLFTGEIEIFITDVILLSKAHSLPFSLQAEGDLCEEMRLKHRFLDMRRSHVHQNMVLRSTVIDFMRRWMIKRGFLEIQTPILTAASPEGARDYVVPSRLYPGEFYALPQAPQQFKQLLMASGFDRYFQIAPCFRDEASRADRSPGEFYQLDLEMAFVSQEDVWAVMEPLLYETFCTFSDDPSQVLRPPFPRIPYDESLATYGTDKPDLRNPLKIQSFKEVLSSPSGSDSQKVWGIKVPFLARQNRRFFEDLVKWAAEKASVSLHYVLQKEGKLSFSYPFSKVCPSLEKDYLSSFLEPESGLLLVEGKDDKAESLCLLRNHLGSLLGLIEESAYAFCWITDFPMYEKGPEGLIFSHNPFSMPQGGMEALCYKDPLSIKAYQYDIVCNGIELSSGAIRNHLPDVMLKVFSLAGYTREHIENQFGALFKAFHYGVPPHGGSAPGIDRMVMLLARTANIREIIPFPLTQNARDLLMGAPLPLSPDRLQELHLSVREKDLVKKN